MKRKTLLVLRGLMMKETQLKPLLSYASGKGFDFKVIKNSYYARDNLSIYYSNLIKAIENLPENHEIYCLGISYGGIVALLALLDKRMKKRIKKVYTLCSPVNGINKKISLLSNIIPGGLGDIVKDLSNKSEKIKILRKLNRKEHYMKVCNIYHAQDILVPKETAQINGLRSKLIVSDYGRCSKLAAHHYATADLEILKLIVDEIMI